MGIAPDEGFEMWDFGRFVLNGFGSGGFWLFSFLFEFVWRFGDEERGGERQGSEIRVTVWGRSRGDLGN